MTLNKQHYIEKKIITLDYEPAVLQLIKNYIKKKNFDINLKIIRSIEFCYL